MPWEHVWDKSKGVTAGALITIMVFFFILAVVRNAGVYTLCMISAGVYSPCMISTGVHRRHGGV